MNYKKVGIDKLKINLENVSLEPPNSWYQDALNEAVMKRIEYQNTKFELWLNRILREYSYSYIKYTYRLAKENGENVIVNYKDEGEFSVLEVFSEFKGYKLDLLARTTSAGVYDNDWLMMEWKILDMGLIRKEGADFINLGLPLWAKYME
ncbi:hypothetical protein CHOTACABRAS_80 [Bacillus phage Chotacabras]|nr:hypothetical protein CHOTACABRAS_80 [Bacillus phage Chotacabras]